DEAWPCTLLAIPPGDVWTCAANLAGAPKWWSHRGEEQYQGVQAAVVLNSAAVDFTRLPRFLGQADTPTTRAGVLLRRGRTDDARQELDGLPGGQAGLAWLLRGLAEQGRGQAWAARLALEEAIRWRGVATNTADQDWVSRLEMDLLTRELEAILA